MLTAANSTYYNRESFEKTKSEIEFPDLLDVQIEAFQSFIQENVPEDERIDLGLQEVFNNVFPLEDPHRNYVFEYKSYFLGLAKYTPEECMDRGLTYSVPLKVRLVLHITNEDDRSKYDQSIEQEVYFGNIPMMTKKGTFVINGAERVIVSQLSRHRPYPRQGWRQWWGINSPTHPPHACQPSRAWTAKPPPAQEPPSS